MCFLASGSVDDDKNTAATKEDEERRRGEEDEQISFAPPGVRAELRIQILSTLHREVRA